MSEANVIETERLTLRRLTMDDLDALAAIYADADVRKYFPEGILTYEQTKEELEWIIRATAATGELVPHEAELVLVPAHADAQPHTPTGELLQRRDLLCEPDRVVERHEHDRGSRVRSVE